MNSKTMPEIGLSAGRMMTMPPEQEELMQQCLRRDKNLPGAVMPRC
ncbi:MAG: hypothetical protein WAO02_09450 [Verrucomicrobiia bacterium]